MVLLFYQLPCFPWALPNSLPHEGLWIGLSLCMKNVTPHSVMVPACSPWNLYLMSPSQEDLPFKMGTDTFSLFPTHFSYSDPIMFTILFDFPLSPIECELHKGRDLCLGLSLMYLQYLLYCLCAVSTLISICWVKLK